MAVVSSDERSCLGYENRHINSWISAYTVVQIGKQGLSLTIWSSQSMLLKILLKVASKGKFSGMFDIVG